MNKFLKNRLFLKHWSISFVFVVLLFFISLFLFTDKAHAESIATVLKGADTGGLGLKIKGIWQTIINLCNGMIVVVLIFVAFAQILRLNINTYGVKKILPTLILAIIAANFSLLFCRLLVDFSSILSDVFINGVGPSAKPGITTSDNVVGAFTTISEGLKIPAGGPNTATGYTFGTLFWYGIGNLMVLAAAVVMVILAYLFLIRAWMIYFLVSIAPLAFMSLVLPQTKSLFNQWWSNLFKWIFMPIVSLFWIWLGAQWITNVGSAGTFMSFVFAGVCLYLAVTTPFKMGGAVMSAWGKIGKWGLDRTGMPGAFNYFKEKGKASFEANKQGIYNRAKGSPLNFLKIGTGLDVAQQRLAEAQRHKGALSSDAKGRFIKKGGDKKALWEGKMQSMEGSEQYETGMILGNLANSTNKKNREKFAVMRSNRAGALASLEEAQNSLKSFDDMMKAAFFDTDRKNKDLVVSEKQAKSSKEFVRKYAKTMYDSQVNAEKAKKLSEDPIRIAIAERLSVDNAEKEFDGITGYEKNKVSLANLNNIAPADRTEKNNQDIKKLTDQIEASRFKEMEDKGTLASYKVEQAELITDKLNQIKSQYGDTKADIPVYLHPLLKFDDKGKLAGLDSMSVLERTRAGKLLGQIISGGATGVIEGFTGSEIINVLKNGSDIEGITKQNMENFFSGHLGKNEADINRKITEFSRAAQSISRQFRNPEAEPINKGMVDLIMERNPKEFQNVIDHYNQYKSPGAIAITTNLSTVATMSPADQKIAYAAVAQEVKDQILPNQGSRQFWLAAMSSSRATGWPGRAGTYMSSGGGVVGEYDDANNDTEEEVIDNAGVVNKTVNHNTVVHQVNEASAASISQMTQALMKTSKSLTELSAALGSTLKGMNKSGVITPEAVAQIRTTLKDEFRAANTVMSKNLGVLNIPRAGRKAVMKSLAETVQTGQIDNSMSLDDMIGKINNGLSKNPKAGGFRMTRENISRLYKSSQ